MHKKPFSWELMKEFIFKLHSLIGIFIGPFIFIASVTGLLYGVAFLFEDEIYHKTLYVNKSDDVKPLRLQVEVAEKLKNKGDVLFSVRPSPSEDRVTRVLFTNANLRSSDYRTIFINPYNLEITNDLLTYGSSGSMPLRRTLDLLHRDLLLGSWGQWYSELAATWLWVTGVTGFILYFRRKKSKLHESKNSHQKLINRHSLVGLICLLGILMLSVTGLTWSRWAGDNISKIRNTFNWHTPQISRTLSGKNVQNFDFNLYDKVQKIAFENGIDSKMIEIKPGSSSSPAWLVTEVGRGLPSQVDAVAIDPETLQVTDKLIFKEFPIMAKITRWGIDLHMGNLFGFWNQVLVVIFAAGIIFLIVTGYLIWFRTRKKSATKSLYDLFLIQPLGNKSILLFTIVVLCLFFPMSLSLLLIAF